MKRMQKVNSDWLLFDQKWDQWAITQAEQSLDQVFSPYSYQFFSSSKFWYLWINPQKSSRKKKQHIMVNSKNKFGEFLGARRCQDKAKVIAARPSKWEKRKKDAKRKIAKSITGPRVKCIFQNNCLKTNAASFESVTKKFTNQSHRFPAPPSTIIEKALSSWFRSPKQLLTRPGHNWTWLR